MQGPGAPCSSEPWQIRDQRLPGLLGPKSTGGNLSPELQAESPPSPGPDPFLIQVTK